MSSPDVIPNTAEIPLPPGMTLEQFQDLQAHLIRIAITASVAFGVITWDYFIQLPSELALYRAKEKNIWTAPATWWFIVLRYSGIVAALPALFFTAAQSDFCQVPVSISAAGAILTVASSGAIFWYRVRALWSGSRFVSAVTGFFYIVMVGCWITVSTQFRSDTGPHTPFLSNCQLHPVAPWAPMSYASSVAFDSCVLVFTLAKFHGNFSASRSKVGRQVYNDNLLYFFLMTAANITVLSIQAQRDPKFNLIKPAAVPFSTLMTVTMGTRVFLNLRLFNERQRNNLTGNSLPLAAHGQHSNPTSSASSNPARQPLAFNTGSKQYGPYGEPYDPPFEGTGSKRTLAEPL
ncbi:hypothetical protein P691DRAFT_776622 [Macrolepiota fuliginosa MF-IS2]|uniref:Uncharacterized protein n=1 Tax=Macrolepiota fuliginosa MF-IS2 TaxID=1400762 RepID=A0A9P5XCE5_9AGAR|nr:hypothetical protein P691DRAFT_776622 [Macrolepiota fuliginosa MF-IS2]